MSFWKNKKVLITGHTGFKGSWMSLLLLNLGSKVSGISLEPSDELNLFDQLVIKKDLNHNIIDIRNKELIKKKVSENNPDFIFHLAAQPLVRESYINPLETWEVNVTGTINLLQSIRNLNKNCISVFITTDKVYKNNEWIYGYREIDPLGGYDPYSSSKAAAEIAINSWRSSFFDDKSQYKKAIASARAGNVIGGGDWSKDRIIPDAIRDLASNKKIKVRNPNASRPWQHVLEPIWGYLKLAEGIYKGNNSLETSFNFGPRLESNKKVKELIIEVLKNWKGDWEDISDEKAFHEAKLLNLSYEKAFHHLNWQPRWDFETTVRKTVNWYQEFNGGKSAVDCCMSDLNSYFKE